ncbi:Trypsin delta [Seminavis robusta]|uniref:Trypsin delta n=1 Tax=Seminavis robusta TaxID=568900 RepID=A0A9N8H311_9STRA|nr:Trypsin delta [Seminavis robusta]|eukprot:Sro77_g042190.1 Trypsin delta (270) ;mRNA; r:92841-93747
MIPSQYLAISLSLLLSVSAGNHIRSHNRNLGFDSTTPTGDVDVNDPNNQGIRGGGDAGTVPWFVRLEGSSVCGGSLIHDDCVLTSASCVDSGFPSTVLVGPTSSSNGTSYTVSGGTIHPSWTGTPDANSDINLAVLKLATTSSNSKATLNSNSAVPSGTDNLQIFGFGLINNAEYASSLQQAFVTYTADCASSYASYNATQTICADATAAATCTGDSGGPVLGADLVTQVAVASFGVGATCTGRTLLGFVRISHAYDWIQSEICSLSSR